MTLFYECSYPMRFSYMLFLMVTILMLVVLLWKLILGRHSKGGIIAGAAVLILTIGLYSVLLDDHIVPQDAVNWQGHKAPLPMAVLWLITAGIFLISVYAILLCREREKRMVTESSIKEAMDEIPMRLCYFRQNGVSMLLNRRMAEISEIICGKVLMTYDELSDMLNGRSDWKEAEDIYRLPDGSFCRYAEEKIATADGERFRAAYFYDVTELVRRKKELETQNEELRRMSAQNRRLRENVGQLAKEEEILFFKTKWHDTMGEGLTAIRRRLLSSLTEKETDDALRSWSNAVSVIQRDNDSSNQRRDAAGDLFRDAGALNITLHISGVLPAKKETEQVFILAIRNCLLNAAMHADATELYADITEAEEGDVLSVTNNGKPPAGEIIPRGGLINVMVYAERMGGRTEIKSIPCFELTVTLPRKEADKR
ncbi:hypothetical protein SAMN02910327_00534 [Peptostreptococcaceae bacterium pGA-8]|nr:hypothetical protein SAMN02910327_00534 [Peptostreptococcaceae bacterium pGA-8]